MPPHAKTEPSPWRSYSVTVASANLSPWLRQPLVRPSSYDKEKRDTEKFRDQRSIDHLWRRLHFIRDPGGQRSGILTAGLRDTILPSCKRLRTVLPLMLTPVASHNCGSFHSQGIGCDTSFSQGSSNLSCLLVVALVLPDRGECPRG